MEPVVKKPTESIRNGSCSKCHRHETIELTVVMPPIPSTLRITGGNDDTCRGALDDLLLGRRSKELFAEKTNAQRCTRAATDPERDADTQNMQRPIRIGSAT